MFQHNTAKVKLEGILFEGNVARHGGGAICAWRTCLHISTSDFVNNTAYAGGAAEVIITTVSLSGVSKFLNNSASFFGGAIEAIDSSINMTGKQYFKWNSAEQGGALAFERDSKLTLADPLLAEFVDNKAKLYGGALFSDDNGQCTVSRYKEDCFIELSSIYTIQLKFINNIADRAGTVLFGGSLYRCRLYVGGGVRDSCGNRIEENYGYNPLDMLCLLYTSPSPRDATLSRMPSSA